MPKFTSFVTSVALAIGSMTPTLADETMGKTAYIVADLSPANRIISDAEYNESISDIVRADIEALILEYGDAAVLRAFGPPGGDSRPLEDWHLSINFVYDRLGGKDPRQLGALLQGRIGDLLNVGVSGPTDLHFSLVRLAEEVDCEASETHIVLLSNMVEAGRFQDGQYWLAKLPPGIFSGCSISIAGFDGTFVSGSAAAQTVAEAAWRETLMAAGFGDVRFLR